MSRRVILFHYTLTNSAGETIDSSHGAEPFPVMEGTTQIIPGLQDELFKMKVGDNRKIHVPHKEAYGPVE